MSKMIPREFRGFARRKEPLVDPEDMRPDAGGLVDLIEDMGEDAYEEMVIAAIVGPAQ